MFETAGPVTVAEPAPLLLLLVLLPIAAALGGRGSPHANVLGALSTLGIALLFAVRVALLAPHHAFVAHLAEVGRFGALDLALDLGFDRASALLGCTVALVALADAVVDRARASIERPLFAAGAMLAVLGDGFAAWFAGAGIATLAALAGGRAKHVVPVTTTLAGIAAALVGAFLLFGAVGPAEESRGTQIALVGNEEGATTLSMTTLAGARVSAEDGPALPGEPLIAPFRVAVEPGVYSLRITTGAASDEAHLEHVTIVKGRGYALAPFGPTASFRALADEASVPRPGTSASLAIFRQGRVLFGFAAADVGLVLLAVGGLALLLAQAAGGGASPSGLAAVLFPVVLAQRAFVALDPAGPAALAIALAASGVAVVLAGNAAASRDGPAIVRHVVAGAGATALVACAAGEPGGGLVLVIASTLLGAGALVALGGARDVRWVGVAAAGLGGLVPFVGASAGEVLTFAAILHLPLLHRALVATVLTIAWGFSAFAGFRIYDRSLGRAASPTLRDGVVVGLVVLGSVVGLALGLGSAAVGGSALPLAERIATPALPIGAAGALAGVAATCASALVGLVLARKVESAPAGGIPASFLVRAATRVGAAVELLATGVSTMDHLVIDDATSAAGGALRRVARVVVAVELFLDRATATAVDRPLARALERADLDLPQKSARIGARVAIAMVALLGVVVLFSLFAR